MKTTGNLLYIYKKVHHVGPLAQNFKWHIIILNKLSYKTAGKAFYKIIFKFLKLVEDRRDVIYFK